MKHQSRKFKKAKGWAKLLYMLVIMAYIISYVFFAKSIISLTGIETVLRYVALVIFLVIGLLYAFINYNKICDKKYTHLLVTTILCIILIIIFSLGSNVIDFLYSKISSFNKGNNYVAKSVLVSLNDTNISDNSVFAMINDHEDTEGYVLANKLISKYKLNQEIKYYDDYLDILYDLYDKKIDAAFLSGKYISLYSNEEDFVLIGSETKVQYEYSEKLKKESNLIAKGKSLEKPFSVLILGVDSETDGLNEEAAFNGDTIILATFNPDTLSATLFSIPRDTYVPIACRNNAYSKINSSAAYGMDCVINTVQDLTGIDIDYYVKINFKGVVDLVDTLGGITVDIEKPDFQFNHGYDCKGIVCEQNSDRLWGDKTVFIEPGVQNIDGEQALAYSRCRGLYAISDLARNKHQQDVIMAIAKKAAKINSYSKFKKTLDSVAKNISTNMTTEQILSGYNILKDMISNTKNDQEMLYIQKSYLEVYNLSVYLPSSGRVSSALGYYESSLEDISNNMKINLGLNKPEYNKTYSYSMNETYEYYVAGKGKTSGVTNSTLANFISSTREKAEAYCSENNIDCDFTYVDENSEYYDESIDTDLIVYQNPLSGTLLRDVDNIHFYINGATSNVLED